jgi:hypothetical protein
MKLIIKKILFWISCSKFREFQHFPFDISKRMPSSAYDEMVAILSACHSLDSTFRITDGTLLGMVRDGHLIKHDNDIDFDVIASSGSESMIRNLACEKKWTIGREVFFDNKLQQLAFYDKNQLIIDFLFWYKEGGFCVNFSERNHVRIQPSNFFMNLKSEYYSSLLLRVPKKIDEWLIYRYGENWMIPDGSKGDWKLQCGDLLNFKELGL